ncbi:MAG: FAD binding domain-containing protein [Acidimicrobiales bacterium]
MTNTFSVPAATESGFISRSHQAIEPFALHRPSTVIEAASLIDSGAVPHAGGIDVVSRLRRGAAAAAVVRLDRIDELRRIEVNEDHLVLGAGVTHAQVESDAEIGSARPDLATAWKTLGNLRIRRTGTIGGNLMAFDSTYDAAPILAAAEARLVFASPDGTVYETSVTDRPETGLLVRCEIPLAGRVVFDRSLKPVVSVAVGNDSVAIGCAYDSPIVVARQGFDQSLLPDPVDDAYATAAYRQRMIEVLISRAEQQHGHLET